MKCILNIIMHYGGGEVDARWGLEGQGHGVHLGLGLNGEW